MPARNIRGVFEHYFEVIGKTEYNGGLYLLVKHQDGTAHRLLSINTESDLDIQLGSKPGSLDALLQQASNASGLDLVMFLAAIHKVAKPVRPTRKAISAYRILTRLRDLQDEKEGTSAQRRTEIAGDIQRLSRSLDAVDAELD